MLLKMFFVSKFCLEKQKTAVKMWTNIFCN